MTDFTPDEWQKFNSVTPYVCEKCMDWIIYEYTIIVTSLDDTEVPRTQIAI